MVKKRVFQDVIFSNIRVFAMPSIVCEIQLEYARMSMKTLTVKCGLKLKRYGIRLYNLISKMFTNRLDGAHRDPLIGYGWYDEFENG